MRTGFAGTFRKIPEMRGDNQGCCSGEQEFPDPSCPGKLLEIIDKG
jgi:hypothetical protein